MKLTAMNLVVVTTFILITVTIFSAMNLPFSWIFYLIVLGQTLLVYTVYKVLKDDYKTDKTFEDFYEDSPVRQ